MQTPPHGESPAVQDTSAGTRALISRHPSLAVAAMPQPRRAPALQREVVGLTSLVVGLLGLVVGLSSLPGLPVRAALLVCGGALLINPLLLWRRWRDQVPGALVIAEALAVLALSCLGTGGWTSPVLLWLPLVPAVALFLSGPVAGLVTTFVAAALAAALYVAHGAFGPDALLRLLSFSSLLCGTTYLAWAFTRASDDVQDGSGGAVATGQDAAAGHNEGADAGDGFDASRSVPFIAYPPANAEVEALRLGEERYRTLVHYASDAICILDDSGHLRHLSPATRTVTGFAPEDLLRRHWLDLLHPEDHEKGRAALATCLDDDAHPVTLQARHRHADGRWTLVEIKACNLTSNPAVNGVVLYVRDVTDRELYEEGLKEAKEQADEMVRLKSSFLAQMSHEIRTPMNGVIGMTALLGETGLTPIQREYLDIIRTSADGLLDIINDILDFSKLEAGRVELESIPFEVRSLVEDAIDVVAPLAAQKRLELAYLIDPNVPHTIMGDRMRVRQVFVNLLSNAVKFTHEGEVFISIEARPLQDDRFQLHVAVRDTGIGISGDRLDYLFQPFGQADVSTARQYGGTGLGLAISKRLSEAMDGMIWAERAPDAGSTFHFTFHTHAVPSEGRLSQRDVLPRLEGKRVLIVDDNETNRRILTLQTKAWGMLPRTADTPSQALAWMDDGLTFDVALLDMQMPEMDGLTLGQSLRATSGGRDLPIILLSSLGRSVEGNGLRLAATLTKPVKQSQMLDVFQRLFENDTLPAPGAQHHGKDPAAPLRILLAEDNPINQKVALRLLDRLGYAADAVNNGHEVLKTIRQRRYDVLLLDVQMPVLDGIATAEQIVGEFEAGHRPHMIALTANALQGDRERCLDAGMDDYVSKPVHLNDLAAALNRYQRRQPAGASPEGVLDTTILSNLRTSLGDDDPDFMEEILGDFLFNANELIQQTCASARAGDTDAVRMSMHALKSTSATFGATRLARLCKELEERCDEVGPDSLSDEAARVAEAFSRVRHAFETTFNLPLPR